MNKLKVFVGPNEIAGQYRNLSLALIKMGMSCEYYTFYENKFNYGGDIGCDIIPKLMRRLNSQGKKHKFLRFFNVILFELLRLVFFVRCALKYDVFIFGFGISLLRSNLDLPLLKLLKKRIIANLSHGSDMTPAYLDGALMDQNNKMPNIQKQYDLVKKQIKTINKFEAYSNVIIGSPLSSSYFAQKDYLDVIKLGRLCQAQFTHEAIDLNYKINENIKIYHAPSHAPGKGTVIIRSIVSKLIENNKNIEYIELQGLENSEILKRIVDASILIDQVYSDLPLSGLGMEAMACGIPVLVSGYGIEAIKLEYHDNSFPPVIVTNPDNLEHDLKLIIENKDNLIKISQNGIDFIENTWSIEKVAEKYKRIIYGDVEGAWIHRPEKFMYVDGYGLSYKQLSENISAYIKLKGASGLFLSHRKKLEEKIINKFCKKE
jgi:glycosyltransferase involved in cell wall biosynthesis